MIIKTLGKTIPTHIRLPADLNKLLNKAAKKLNTSKAEVIRHLLKEGVVRL